MTLAIDAFYGGHVQMEGHGFDGPAAGSRRYSDTHLATVYDEAERFAELMERLGYDTLWLAEHHFQREGYGGISNVPLLSLHLAHLTQQLKFGAFFNTVTAWHPLRLAEDYASVDVLTGGRFRFGIGRGYIAREVETLGGHLQDDQANRDLFEEQVEIMLKAWHQSEFAHYGSKYRIPAAVPHMFKELVDITLVPRPVTLPVEVWQPITSAKQRGFDFMARHGIKGVIAGGTAPGGRAEELADLYRDGLARAGCEAALGEGLAIGVQVHIADTRRAALREAAPWFEEQLKALAPLGRFPHLTGEQIRGTAEGLTARGAGLPTIQDADDEGAWVCGPPDYVRDHLLSLIERLPGLRRIFIQTGSLGVPPSAMRADLEWFSQDVMPKIEKAVPAA
jgi:alkanesulfonate monooxygenase SsuD/methylene tetrahydromethanopterin reductase-like flavin-dependent oxidoreductase (luciferase family)